MSKKALFLFVIVSIFMLNFAFALNQQIWTTANGCEEITDEETPYFLGDSVYINGKNFDAGQYNFSIAGANESGNCDKGVVVVSGAIDVGESGEFCALVYSIDENDCGEYEAEVAGNYYNYFIENDPPVVPEFSLIIGLTTIVGALITIFVIRKN